MSHDEFVKKMVKELFSGIIDTVDSGVDTAVGTDKKHIDFLGGHPLYQDSTWMQNEDSQESPFERGVVSEKKVDTDGREADTDGREADEGVNRFYENLKKEFENANNNSVFILFVSGKITGVYQFPDAAEEVYDELLALGILDEELYIEEYEVI